MPVLSLPRSCLAVHSGTRPLCSLFFLPNLDGELSQLWRGSNIRSSDHCVRMLLTALLTAPPSPHDLSCAVRNFTGIAAVTC